MSTKQKWPPSPNATRAAWNRVVTFWRQGIVERETPPPYAPGTFVKDLKVIRAHGLSFPWDVARGK